MRQTVPHVKFELFFGCFGTFSQDDKGMGRLTPFLVWHTDDSDFVDRRVAQETAFHLDRRDVLSATDNYSIRDGPNFRRMPVLKFVSQLTRKRATRRGVMLQLVRGTQRNHQN